MGAVIFTALSVVWELCGAEGVARKSRTEVHRCKELRSREDQGTRQGSGGVACAGVGQKMGGQEGEGRGGRS